jgi:TRAP-type C4-dicarboxylate transport system substrate-binding protein
MLKTALRTVLRRVLIAGLTLAAITTGAPEALAQRRVLVKMASPVPEGSVWHRILKQMEQEWSEASQGRVKLRIYPGQTAGDDPVVVTKMRLGTLHAALLAGVGSVVPEVYALQVPMMYRSYDEVDYVLDKMKPRLNAAFEKEGFVVLNWTDAGWVHFFTKQSVATPEELKKLKLFAWAGDDDVIETYKAAGFNPIPLPSTEVATALQTGLVTAMPAPPQAAVIMQWYKHASHMTEVNWAVLIGATVISKKTWDSIPADLQPALRQAAEKAGAALRSDTRSNGPRDVDAMVKRGLSVVTLNDAQQAIWHQTVEDAYPRIRGSVVPADAFDEARRYLEEYRRQHTGAGGR